MHDRPLSYLPPANTGALSNPLTVIPRNLENAVSKHGGSRLYYLHSHSADVQIEQVVIDIFHNLTYWNFDIKLLGELQPPSKERVSQYHWPTVDLMTIIQSQRWINTDRLWIETDHEHTSGAGPKEAQCSKVHGGGGWWKSLRENGSQYPTRSIYYGKICRPGILCCHAHITNIHRYS